MGENPGAPVGGQTHQEGHHGFLAHIRGPKDEGRKEEEQVPVAATTRPAERGGEGEVEEDDADEGEPAEDQEGTELVDPDNGEDHTGHDAHRTVGDNAHEIGRRQREVEMAKTFRQHCPLGVVPVVVGDPPVEVVDHPDLHEGHRAGGAPGRP